MTALEFIENKFGKPYDYLDAITSFREAEELMIEFAKFHVEAALKAVSDKFRGGIDDDAHEEIFSSYPLDNIK